MLSWTVWANDEALVFEGSTAGTHGPSMDAGHIPPRESESTSENVSYQDSEYRGASVEVVDGMSEIAPSEGGAADAWQAEAAAYVELPALPMTPQWARRHAHAVLGAWLIAPATTEIVVLLVSELVTNALSAMNSGHLPLASPDPALIRLTLRHQPGQLVIEVFDASPDPPVLTDTDPAAESGRGLMLVQALSKEWSFDLLPSGGKVVYCVLST